MNTLENYKTNSSKAENEIIEESIVKKEKQREVNTFQKDNSIQSQLNNNNNTTNHTYNNQKVVIQIFNYNDYIQKLNTIRSTREFVNRVFGPGLKNLSHLLDHSKIQNNPITDDE